MFRCIFELACLMRDSVRACVCLWRGEAEGERKKALFWSETFGRGFAIDEQFDDYVFHK